MPPKRLLQDNTAASLNRALISVFAAVPPFSAKNQSMIPAVAGPIFMKQLQKVLSNMRMILAVDQNRPKLNVINAMPIWDMFLMTVLHQILSATELILHP